MARWTRFVLRHRLAVVVFWLAVLLLGGFAGSKLSPLLSNTFSVPGTDSERVRSLLQRRFGDRPDGSFTVVFTVRDNLDPIFNQDLRTGELLIALPIALLILLLVFGLSAAVTIPLLFAACTIEGTLGILYGVAHLAQTPTYTTNLVQLIGLGIAVDYS